MSREGEHALVWARAPCHALLPKIPFPSRSGMLPKTFSWKLLPQSTRVWLFPAAQAKENHLSQTHPFAAPSQVPSWCFFLPLKLHPCPCRSPCPQQPCNDVTGERSSFPALHQPVWAQQSASCSSDFPWKKFIPLLPPEGGSKLQREPGLEE